MNLRDALAGARQRLTAAGIEDPSMEAEVLLRHVLTIDRASLYAAPERELTGTEAAAFDRLLTRRLAGEPSAYLTGVREFYGLPFRVTPDVLIPRPETELLVERAVTLCREHEYRTAADVGAGSGVITVCLASNIPGLRVYATDTSGEALGIAQENATTHGVTNRISFICGDGVAVLPGRVDLICANPPYVLSADIPADGPLSYEPRTALDGGPDGLSFLNTLCDTIFEKLRPGGAVLLEVGEGQAETVLSRLKERCSGGTGKIHFDLADIGRLVEFRLTP